MISSQPVTRPVNGRRGSGVLTQGMGAVLTVAEVDEWRTYRRLIGHLPRSRPDPDDFRQALKDLGITIVGPEQTWNRLLIPASEVEERAVRWLWRNRIPRRTTTVLAGLGGLAKSQVIVSIIGEATRGELTGRPEEVIYFSAEDDPESVIVPRLKAAGAVGELVYLMKVGEDFLLREEHLRVLEQALQVKRPPLIVFDPLVAFIDRETDTWKVQDVRLVLRQLQGLASKYGTAILAVIHFNKGGNRDVLHRISGSAGFGDACRSALAAAEYPPDSQNFVLAHVKSNYGKRQPMLRYYVEEDSWTAVDGDEIATSHVVLDGEAPDLTIQDVFEQKPGPEPDREARNQAVEFLTSWLKRGPVESEEVRRAARRLGISDRMLRHAQDELRVVKEGHRDKNGRMTRYTWRLPSATERY